VHRSVRRRARDGMVAGVPCGCLVPVSPVRSGWCPEMWGRSAFLRWCHRNPVIASQRLQTRRRSGTPELAHQVVDRNSRWATSCRTPPVLARSLRSASFPIQALKILIASAASPVSGGRNGLTAHGGSHPVAGHAAS
jgi:hypothetical protein